MKQRRFAALLLSLALTLSLAAPASAAGLVPLKRTGPAPFADTKGAWCEAAVDTIYQAGLMDGRSATAFDPAGELTYAQITVIAARLHSLLNGGDGTLPAPAEGEEWYQPAADYLFDRDVDINSTAGFLLPLGALADNADTPCDRFDFVWYLAAVLPESALAPINAISALPDVDNAVILRFYNAGILTGSDEYGTFHGLSPLTRGQAAAMLARVVDPTQRVKFTPKTQVMSQAVLDLAPETVLLTVDGYDVTAEAYAYFLCQNIAAAELENYFSYYETYPAYYEAYWKDQAFEGSFADFLMERYHIDVEAPIAWNTPDKGGMTPALKVRQETLRDVKTLAVLMSHQGEYPLTAVQEKEAGQTAAALYGFSDRFAALLTTADYLSSNLAAKYVLSPAQLTAFLAENGYLYGQCLTVFRGDEGIHAADQEARAAAEHARRQMADHLDDPEYLEYLLWKYSEDYDTLPGLIPISELSAANQSALKALSVGQVSAVLTEDDRYLVVLKQDPSGDQAVLQSAADIPAQAQLLQWANDAKVALTPAYNAVDVSAAAAAYDALNG